VKDLATSQIFSLEKKVSSGDYSLKEIGEFIPGAVMVQDLGIPQVTYMNDWGCETLGHSMSEINALGSDYYEKFSPGQAESLLRGMQGFFDRADQTEAYGFFQQVKVSSKFNYNWFYTICKLMLE